MANKGQPNQGLDAIVTAAGEAARRGPPPVHLWNPPFCGDLDLRIARDGTWYYLKTPIGRPSLVKLFASVLKREGDKYFLVTPVEKVGIVVEDAPYLAVELRIGPSDPPIPRPELCIFERTSMTGSPAVQATRSASSRSLKPEA